MIHSRGWPRKALCLPVVMAVALLGFDVAHGQLRLVAWGDGTLGQTNVPAGLTDIKAIAAGYYHNLLLRSNGLVVAWGDGSVGQTNVPANLSSVAAIAAGQYHSLALRSNGTVVAWGLNGDHQTNVPPGLNSVMAIAAGGFHSLALKSNGTVVAWGRNSSGQTNVPAGLSGVAAVSAGDTHSLVLKSNGTVLAWGDDNSGQTNTPASLSSVKAIAAGYHHNLALRSNSTVTAWELDVYGESSVPGGLSNVVAVAASYFYSMALKGDGTVVAWGQDFNNQTNAPPGLINVTAIAAGHDHSLALTPSPVCPPGFPDNFECRAPLTGSNLAFSVSNVGATQEPSEPFHFDLDAGKSLWYSWTAPFSGGAVITMTSDFITPCLAVYTGTNLATLTQLVRNNTTFNQSRVVFNAGAGTNYLIAVDGTLFNGSSGEGSNYVTLELNPPPANDLFANRAPIPGTFYQTSNSFIGATQETGEPTHTNSNGDATFRQTLWWSWTAPTNLGVTAIPVRLTADGVSFPPNLGVYTGASVLNLTNVPSLSARTDGMTRLAGFTATAGTTYQIALGGLQYDSVGINASPRFGDYRLRLNIRGLVLGITGLNPTTNLDDSITFIASAQVTNYGSAPSYPLRILVTTNSGISVKGQDSGTTVNNNGVVMTTNFPALAVGQGVVKRITGTVPAPTENGNQTLGVGYGAYAELQEQVGTNWITLDQALVLFGDWPGLGGFGGPGGGVIRIDPGLSGSAFNPLTNVFVSGPLTIPEGSTAAYAAHARFANGFQYDFTNTLWTATRFSITTNGALTAGSVTSNSPVTLAAQYISGTFTYSAASNVIVLNLPPPSWSANGGFSNQQFKVSLNGVAGRKHVVEATTNLSAAAFWVPIATNFTATNGIWIFLDSAKATNFSRRFYRAREAE